MNHPQPLNPKLNPGTYVFCSVADPKPLDQSKIIGSFREAEGVTLILEKSYADQMRIPYTYVAAWISLSITTSLEAVGITASFSAALAEAGISCNVVAGYYHDHIFVAASQAQKAMAVLESISN